MPSNEALDLSEWEDNFKMMRMVRLSITLPIYVTATVASLVFGIASALELDRYQFAIALTTMPFLSGLLAMWFFYIRGSLPSDDRNRTVERQIANTWGRPLSKLHMLITLSQERTSLTHTELEKTLQDNSTHIYGLIAIGYKCIQTCNAIHTLCARGFPDQALSLCRGLVEQEANLRFIVAVENREEVTERYLDWERAKAIRRLDKNRELVKGNLDPANAKWDAIAEAYEQLKVKHRGNGDLKKYEQWAIGTSIRDSKQLKAFSAEARAKQFIKILDSEKTLFGYTWAIRWQRLNDFVHTTPRSIVESAASNDPKLVVTGPSHLGIDEPAVIAGQTILNISTLLAQIVTDEYSIRENLRIKDIGEKSHKVFYSLLKEVEKVPGSKRRWYATLRLDQKQSSRRP